MKVAFMIPAPTKDAQGEDVFPDEYLQLDMRFAALSEELYQHDTLSEEKSRELEHLRKVQQQYLEIHFPLPDTSEADYWYERLKAIP